MQRTFNYTGRSRITRDEVAITVIDQAPEPPAFDVQFGFLKRFPPESRLYVEAYHKATLQRFDYGTVGNPKPPAHRVLDSVDLTGSVLFRVRVVDESGSIGRLLGAAEAIRPEGDDDDQNRDSLMVLKSGNLESLPWRVEMDSADGKPILWVNNRIPDAISRAKTDPTFFALVMPAALHQVLTHMVVHDDLVEDGEEEGAKRNWITMAESLHSPLPDSRDRADLEDWVDSVVQGFCQRMEITDALVSRMEERAS